MLTKTLFDIKTCNGENHYDITDDTMCDFKRLPCGCADLKDYEIDEYIASVKNPDIRVRKEVGFGNGFTIPEDRTVGYFPVTKYDVELDENLESYEELNEMTNLEKDVLTMSAVYKVGVPVPYPRTLIPHTTFNVKVEYVVACLNTGNPYFGRYRTFCYSCFDMVNQTDEDGLAFDDSDGTAVCGYNEICKFSEEYQDETSTEPRLYVQVDHRPSHQVCQLYGVEEARAFASLRHDMPIFDETETLSIQDEFYCDVCTDFIMRVSYA